MLMKSKKHLDGEKGDSLSTKELKSDLIKGIVITILCILLSFITYKMGDCYREALFCTKVAILSTVVMGYFYLKAKNE